MTFGFRATLYRHLMLDFASSTTETKKRAVLEVGVNQDFDVLLSFVLFFSAFSDTGVKNYAPELRRPRAEYKVSSSHGGTLKVS